MYFQKSSTKLNMNKSSSMLLNPSTRFLTPLSHVWMKSVILQTKDANLNINHKFLPVNSCSVHMWLWDLKLCTFLKANCLFPDFGKIKQNKTIKMYILLTNPNHNKVVSVFIISYDQIFCPAVAMSTTGDKILDTALSKVRLFIIVTYCKVNVAMSCTISSVLKWATLPTPNSHTILTSACFRKKKEVIDECETKRFFFYLPCRLVRRVCSPKSWRMLWRGMSECDGWYHAGFRLIKALSQKSLLYCKFSTFLWQ